MNEQLRARAIAAGLLLALSLGLASCAATTTKGSPGGGTQAPLPVGRNSARLKVYVTDQYNRPLERTTVELRSLGDTAFRSSASTDAQGTVTLTGLPTRAEGTPTRLQLIVNARHGYYSDTVEVQGAGTTESRVMVQTNCPPPDPGLEALRRRSPDDC